MDQHAFSERLSRVTTCWNLVRDAHADDADEAITARNELMQRYHGAAYRYLVASLRDVDRADEVFQEFALRFARGDFRNADPGRFRQYLKTALINLVRQHHRGAARGAAVGLDAEVTDPDVNDPADDVDESFIRSWRDELLARAWGRLAEVESEQRRPWFTALLYRSQHPEANSTDIAIHITQQMQADEPVSEAAARKLLQRARDYFADTLLDDVAFMLETVEPDRLEEELTDLGLLGYCRSALKRRRGQDDG